MRKTTTWLAIGLLAPCLAACGEGSAGESSSAEKPATPITNRIDVPPSVRKNLDISFVEVAYRNVARTRRIPGQFEFLPEAHRSYHAAMEGQVELLVKQYQEVAPGDVLFRIDSPTWRELQLSMANTVIAIRSADSKLESIKDRTDAVAGHGDRLEDQRRVWEDRLRELDELASAGAGNKSARTAARAQLASLRTSLAEVVEEKLALESEAEALRTELQGYEEATPLLFEDAGCNLCVVKSQSDEQPRDLALSRAAALLGVEVQYLRENVGTKESPRQRWREIDDIEVKARQAGVVEALPVTNGAWVHIGDVVLETVEQRLIRFRASGLQSDLGWLKDGLPALIVPPGGRAADESVSVAGILTLGTEADPLARRIDLIVVPTGEERAHWVRSGVSTEVEVTLEGTAEPQLAIPVTSVIKDGLEKIIFRRDPKDPNKVIRLAADLGLSDGRWVVIESGVMEGDQVVDHGVYELMLAGGGPKQKGGHFHADGTWHAGPHH